MLRCVLSILIFLTALPAAAGPGYGNGRTIHIRHDTGGDLGLYMVKVAVVKELGLNVVIDGVCASACTLLTAVPPSQICVTRRARLHFHRARLARPVRGGAALVRTANEDMLNTYPAGIRAWIGRHGGLTDRMLRMGPQDVATFLPLCDSRPVGS